MEKDRLKREAEAEGKEIDLSKTLGEIWRSMDAEKRQPYVDIFNEDRERYNKQMNEYENRNTKKQKVDAKTEETSVEP
jgi:non-histone protein 10